MSSLITPQKENLTLNSTDVNVKYEAVKYIFKSTRESLQQRLLTSVSWWTLDIFHTSEAYSITLLIIDPRESHRWALNQGSHLAANKTNNTIDVVHHARRLCKWSSPAWSPHPLGNFQIFDYTSNCQVWKSCYMILSHSHPASLGSEPPSDAQQTWMPRSKPVCFGREAYRLGEQESRSLCCKCVLSLRNIKLRNVRTAHQGRGSVHVWSQRH